MCGDGYVRYCRPHAAMARTLSLVLMVTRTPDTGHRVGKDSEGGVTSGSINQNHLNLPDVKPVFIPILASPRYCQQNDKSIMHL